MVTTCSIPHHVLTLLQFLVVAVWSSSNQVLSGLLSPLILFFQPSRLVSQRPRSVVSALSQHPPFSPVGFCPFPTHVLVDDICWAPTVIENCSLYQGKLKNSQQFLGVAVGALLWAQRRSSLRNASCRPALPSCWPSSVTGPALVLSGEGEMIFFPMYTMKGSTVINRMR